QGHRRNDGFVEIIACGAGAAALNLDACGKVLVLGSNATRIEVQGGGTGPTGNYLNETVVPAMALIEAGYNLVLATPNGTKPHIDEASDSAVHFGGDQAAYS